MGAKVLHSFFVYESQDLCIWCYWFLVNLVVSVVMCGRLRLSSPCCCVMLRHLVSWASHSEKWLRFFMLMVLSCFISTPWPCVLVTSATGQSSDLIHSDTVTNQRDSIVLFTIWHMHLSSASHCSRGHENVSLFGLCSVSHCWMLHKTHSTSRAFASQPT